MPPKSIAQARMMRAALSNPHHPLRKTMSVAQIREYLSGYTLKGKPERVKRKGHPRHARKR